MSPTSPASNNIGKVLSRCCMDAGATVFGAEGVTAFGSVILIRDDWNIIFTKKKCFRKTALLIGRSRSQYFVVRTVICVK
jgi:hypothetical protein